MDIFTLTAVQDWVHGHTEELKDLDTDKMSYEDSLKMEGKLEILMELEFLMLRLALDIAKKDNQK